MDQREAEKRIEACTHQRGQSSGRHALWLALLAPALALVVGLVALGVSASTPLSLAGYAIFQYGDDLTDEPTAYMNQSKVWWNDGIWWGVLYNLEAGEYRIYRLNPEAHEWLDTGVAVDEREDSRSDVLWDEAAQKLYIASQAKRENPSTEQSDPIYWARLYRYSYDATNQSYTLDDEDGHFPVAEVNRYRTESLVLDKDSTGRLWATWVARLGSEYAVFAAYTTGNDWTWGTPFVLPFTPEATVSSDDISTLIAFSDNSGPKIGVLWGNQLQGRFYFATHNDSQQPEVGWSLDSNFMTAVTAPADDHLSIAATATGELFMVVKTGIEPDLQPDETLIALITRETDGTTTFIEVAPGNSRDTRPMAVVNESSSQLYVFTVNRPGGEAVCIFPAMITSPLSEMSFLAQNCSPPDGEPEDSPAALAGLLDADIFIGDADTYLLTHNPTSTKQRLTNASGVLVLASDEHTNSYVYNLEGYTPPEPTPTTTGTPGGTATPTAGTPPATATTTATATATAGTPPATDTAPTATSTSEPQPLVRYFLPYLANP